MRERCPKCGEDFHRDVTHVPGRAALPRRLFGLLAAQPAAPDRLRVLCMRCGYRWTEATADAE